MEVGEREAVEAGRQAQIEALVRQLSETEHALQELLAGEVDAVIDPVRGTPFILRQAQVELRRSEARTRMLLENAPAVVWTTDTDLRITSIAGKEMAVLGMTPDRVVGTTLPEAAKELPSLAGMLAAHYRALEGQRASYEARVGERVFSGAVEPLWDENRRTVGCVGLGLDVTRQRRIEDVFDGALNNTRQRLEALAERTGELAPEHLALVQEVLESSFTAVEELQVSGEELHQQNEELIAVHNELEISRRHYRDLFQSAPDGYLVTDPAGIIRRANQAAEELLGAREELLRDKPLVLNVAEGERAQFHRRLDRVKAGENSGGEWELRVRSHTRGVFPAALTVSPIRDAKGELTGLRWLLRDISPSKRAEERERLLEKVRTAAEEAQAANTLMRTLLNVMPVGVVVCNADGALLMTNPPGQEILGGQVYGNIEAPKRPYTSYYPNGTPFPTSEMPLARAMELGETVSGVEILIRREDGSERTLLAGAAPVHDDLGQIISGVTVFQDITEHKRAQDALRRERNLLLTVMENTHAHLAYLDTGFNFLMVNAAYAEGTGYSKEELVGRNHFALFPYAENQAIFEQVRDTGEPVAFQARPFAFPDQIERGTTYWDWTLVPVKEDSRVRGLVFSLVDVTAQEQTRQALRRYAERLRGLYQTSQATLTAHSLDDITTAMPGLVSGLLDCVRADLMLYDFEAGTMTLLAAHTAGETAVDKGWRASIDTAWVTALQSSPDDVHLIADLQQAPPTSAWQVALQAEQVRALLAVPMVIDGALVGSLNLGMSEPGPVMPDKIEIAQELATQLTLGIQQVRLREQVQRYTEDLEERVRRRTAALRASNTRFRVIFEDAAIGIALIDQHTHMIASNPSLQSMLGYSADELKGIALTRLSHPDILENDAQLYRELLDGKRRHYQVEGRYVHKEGYPIDVNVVVSLVQQQRTTDARYAIVMIEDISEKKAAQAALIQSEKLALTGRLAASLAHEINNPLQSVVGFLSLVEESTAPDKEMRHYVRIAIDEIKRAAGLVRQLRNINHPTQGEEKQGSDVNAIIEQMLSLSRKKCGDQNVEIIWEPADEVSPILAIPNRLQQVFLNLVFNALDAMPEGGTLHVSTARTESPAGVEIRFADSGVGIPVDNIANLFKPFYTTKATGLGLGLYISYEIIQTHNGHITVESEVGKGTTFTVWLPATTD